MAGELLLLSDGSWELDRYTEARFSRISSFKRQGSADGFIRRPLPVDVMVISKLLAKDVTFSYNTESRMNNPFSFFENEEIFIIHKSGERTGPHKASFEKKVFTVSDPEIEIERGDTIERPINQKKSERYKVTEVTFTRGLQGLPSSWDISVRDEGVQVDRPAKSVTNHITINNSQGFQIGDHNVQTIIEGFKNLVTRIDESNASREEKEEAKGKLSAFLEHPLTVSVLGGAAAGLTALLQR